MDYLLDVPVKINIWVREECQRKQFEVIKTVKPSILFLQSDGGRNKEEWDIIMSNRKMIEDGIDWNCKIYKIYSDSNLGMYAMSRKCHKKIWSTVDRCILLEDDQIPSPSYFKFCAELLERYQYDERIECICGMNHLENYDCSSDYFFSRQGSIWGIATWKRVTDNWFDFDYGSDEYIMKLLKQRTAKNPISWKRIKAYANDLYYEGHPPGSEFHIEFDMYAHHRLQIIPKVNMISNIGATSDSEHSDSIHLLPRGIRKVFNMPSYDMHFPLKHPKYVVADVYYEKKRNRIMGYNHPFICFYRKVERAFLMIRFGKINKLVNKIFNKKNEK